MYSGIYIRVGTENKLLEEMNELERNEWLQTREKDGLIRTINRLCSVILSLNNDTICEEDDEGEIQ